MDTRMVAQILEEMGKILELKGENTFKVRAYHNAARAILGLEEDLGTLVAEKRLTSVRGIGKGLAVLIDELVATGRLQVHEDLKQEFPLVFKDLLRIPGLGPKKARVVMTELGIASVDELEAAAREDRVAGLPGFGAKTQEKILEGIERFRRSSGRNLLSVAEREALTLLDALRALPGVNRIELAGSLRRRMEVVKDIDIVIATSDAGPIMEGFVGLPPVAAVTVLGETKTSVRLASGIAADLRCVTDEEFPAALVYFTGSKEHNVALRGRAIRKGFGLNEYGLYRDGDFENSSSRVPCPDEAAVYRALDLPYIEPELREGNGEIEAAEAGRLPELVRPTDIRGLLHQHTNWSDGRNTMEEMVQAAIGLGLEYYGITDHSVSAGYAGGLSIERVRQQHAVIDRLNEELDGRIVLLKGIESDILKDGSLDYPEEVLDTFDYVVGSLHTYFGLDEAEQTERLVRAVSQRHLRILGHPTARLLLRRDPCVFNMRAVLDAAAANDVAVEINANPRRLDIDWRECRAARDRGCRFAINPDAHDTLELRNTRFGVDMARKGWLTAKDVINTMNVEDVRRFLGRQPLG